MRRLTAAFSILLLSAALTAQAPAAPAPELKQLEPFVGNWRGAGEATFGPGAPTTKWKGHGTYRWALDGHWLQEDFVLEFEGLSTPLVKHGFLGWDGDGKRYVKAGATSSGDVSLHELVRLDDGTFVEMSLRHRDGMPIVTRSRMKAAADSLEHDIAMWMADGPLLPVTTATFQRCDDACTVDLATPAFAGTAPHADMRRFARSAGEYATAGTVTAAPGVAPFQIHGTETFRAAFGDTVFVGVSRGKPDGAPDSYEGHVLWGRDAARGCILGVYVGNHGEVTTMDARWLANGKLATTSQVTQDGRTRVERFVMEFGADGAPRSAVSHELVDDLPPSETFRITYTRK